MTADSVLISDSMLVCRAERVSICTLSGSEAVSARFGCAAAALSLASAREIVSGCGQFEPELILGTAVVAQLAVGPPNFSKSKNSRISILVRPMNRILWFWVSNRLPRLQAGISSPSLVMATDWASARSVRSRPLSHDAVAVDMVAWSRHFNVREPTRGGDFLNRRFRFGPFLGRCSGSGSTAS